MNNASEGSVKAMGTRPVANAPDISQISCLGGDGESQNGNAEVPAPVHYSKGGDWYKDLSGSSGPEHTQRTSARETDSEFVRLSKQGGHKDLLKVSGCDESPFTNAKEIYLKKDRMSPSHSQPAGVPHANINVAPGNPIWLGGEGPEEPFVPGKKFMKQDNRGSPFAVSDDWVRTQGRNPDKI